VGTTLVGVDAVGMTYQRDHGSAGGEREDEGQGCDVGLHGWTPLKHDEMASNNENVGDFTEVAREAVHTPSNVVLAGREGRVSDPNSILSA
jgi:hypothetical protein